MENQKHWWNTPEGIEWLSNQPEIEQMFLVSQRKRCPLPNSDKSQAIRDAALAEILREAAEIIAAVPTDYAPENLRRPIVDELEGFALMLEHTPPSR